MRFIYGGAGSGKSYYCLKDIEKRIDKGEKGPFIILVPQQFSFEAQKRLLNLKNKEGILLCEVLDFSRLSYKVFRDVGGLNREHIKKPGREILVSYLIDKNYEKFKFYRGVYDKKSFRKSISDTLSELKKFGVEPEALKSFAEKLEEGEPKNKLLDIALIYENYDKYLHEKYIDEDDDLLILKNNIRNYEGISNWQVYIDGYSNFNKLQLDIIEELLINCKRVSVTLTTGSSDEIFEITKKTEDKILKLLKKNNISLEEPVNLNLKKGIRFKDSKALAHLSENIYVYPPCEFLEDTEDITLYASSNSYTEIEEVSRRIVSLVRDEKVRYSEIGVILGDTTYYQEIIPAVFREYEIPFFMDRKKDIEGNLLIVYITSLLDMGSHNFSYEAVFRYLKTGFSNLSLKEVDLLENYIYASGIKGKNKYANTYSFSYMPYRNLTEDQGKELLLNLNEIKNRFSEPVIDFHKALEKCSNVEEMCTLIFDFLNSQGIPDKIEEMVQDFKEKGMLYESREYIQIWNTFIELLEEMVASLGGEKLDVPSFKKYLYAGVLELKMGFIPASIDEVTVGNVDRIKNENISHIFLVGVNDGAFPKNVMEDPVLNDNDRQLLLEGGIEISRDSRAALYEEQFVVYETLLRASKSLHISYAAGDLEGGALRPSIIIGDIKKIFPKVKTKGDLASEIPDREQISRLNPSYNYLLLNAFKLRKREDATEELKALYKYINVEHPHKYGFLKRAINYKNATTALSKSEILDIYGERFTLSVSRLEKFIKCPFSFYMQFGLEAKDRKKYELSMPDLGSFMHKAILLYSKALSRDNMKWKDATEEYCKEKTDSIVCGMLLDKDGQVFKDNSKFTFMAKRLKKVLYRTLSLLTLQFQKGNFEPYAYEARFGKSGIYPPVIVKLSDGQEIYVEGVIDRIDMLVHEGKTYVRIVDYKSSSMTLNLSEIYSGLKLQLLLYLDAVLEGDSSFIPSAVLYFKIDDPLIKAKGEVPEEEILKAIFKKFKMSGLLLKDQDIIKEMDSEIGKSSTIIPAGFTKEQEFVKGSKVYEKEEFDLLRSHVRSLIYESCEKISRGNIDIAPYKKGNEVPCTYCSYASVCGFQNGILNNKYRIINEIDDKEVIDILRKEVSSHE